LFTKLPLLLAETETVAMETIKIKNSILAAAVKEFCKSFNIYLNYGRKYRDPFFDSHCTLSGQKEKQKAKITEPEQWEK
jgi:hypothetical protein